MPWAARLGLILVYVLTVPPLAAAVLLVARVPLSPLTLWISLALVAAWVWRFDRPGAGGLLAAAGGVLVVSCAAVAPIFDLSFDGQTYHQVAIRQLAGGWNPVWAPSAAESAVSAWHVFALPKAAWLLEAMIARATGVLEAAKGVHLIALAAAFLCGRAALETLGVRPRAATGAALLAAANPIALEQLYTFYVDGLLASALLIVLALLVLAWQRPERRWRVGLALAAAFLANLKFSGLMYAAVLGAALVVLVAWRARGRLREALVLGGASAALALAMGINPYVTNTVIHGHPAYPALGRDRIALEFSQDPVFSQQPRPVQLLRSVFSRSAADDERPARLKAPFVVHTDELGAFDTVDTRLGGWGPLFGGALLLSWGILALAGRRGAGRARMLAGVSVALFLSGLLIPFGYYARYTPQLWLACIPALLVDDLRSLRSRVLALVLAVDVVLVAGISLGAQLVNERLHRAQLRGLAAASQGSEITYTYRDEAFLNVDLHFDAFGLRARGVAEPTCALPSLLLRTHALVCLGDGRSPAPPPDPRVAAGRVLWALGIH